MKNTFEIDDLIKIAKRENNTKRSYLYVNPVQGKHIPVSPSLSLELFHQLAGKVEERYIDEKVLVIGFAETATAIGSAIACKARNCKYYLNTTREDIKNAEYLFFTESHSHATEQRLVANGLDECLRDVDRVIFAEDEVTTGNTIEKLIRLLQKRYSGKDLKFGIISILNSMSEQRLKKLQEEGIVCDFLHHIPAQYRVDEISHRCFEYLRKEPACDDSMSITEWNFSNCWNSRVVSRVSSIREKLDLFVQDAFRKCNELKMGEDVLILGTEEFMYPAMLLGAVIENRYPELTVRFHATTRSPIEICDDMDYPLHNRMPLDSLYGECRRTFIYNLRKYDKVIIVTDAPTINSEGLRSIYSALKKYGNDNLVLIRWSDSNDEK